MKLIVLAVLLAVSVPLIAAEPLSPAILTKHAQLAREARLSDQQDNKVTCDLCKATVAGVQELLRSKGVKEKAEEFMRSMCAKLSFLEEQCDEMVVPYVDAVFEVIEDSEPDVFCELVKFCE